MKFMKTPMTVFIVCVSAAMLAACNSSGGGSSGTNTAARGISGTGYAKGAVQRFGSIYVNGREFKTANAKFIIEGNRNATQEDLIVGNVVEIEATFNKDGTAIATKVFYDAELEGPVANKDTANNTFTVAGQTVQVSAKTVFEGTRKRPRFDFASMEAGQNGQLGDIVEVSGTIDAKGILHASSVELQQPPVQGPVEVEVKGEVSNLNTNAKTFQINELTVDYSGLSYVEVDDDQHKPISADLLKHQFVEVSGTLTAQGLNAESIELEDRYEVQDGEAAEIEGIVDAVGASSFTLVGGLKVAYDGKAFEEGATAADIQPGVSVEVEGVVGSKGVLQAIEIEIEDAENEPAIEIAAKIGHVNTNTNPHTSTISLLGGIQVKTTGETRLVVDEEQRRKGFTVDDLRTGVYVEIAANTKDGQLVATKVELGEVEKDEQSGKVEVELQGPYGQKVASDVFAILGVKVHFTKETVFHADDSDKSLTADAFFHSVKKGGTVEVNGTFDKNTMRIEATEVSLEANSAQEGGSHAK